MTVVELNNELNKNADILVIDVRELFELEICSIKNALHIPMGQIANKISAIPTNKDVVIMCHYGVRSAQVVQFLRLKGLIRVFNLEGGIESWAAEVDSEMSRY